ncbi:MAG: flavin reductase family protein [Paludibacter sp.]|jgi:flavin reductase (DIM6/NTAB) family NADH-FMN oxidoreductase RutF|nr:flavin reductase family protein [Paludibacter sp.]
MKISWKPGTMIYPLPAALVSCGATETEFNLLTVSWLGTICSNPPMCYISVRPERHSYEIIKRNMAFVINLTCEDIAKTTDWCGVRSGKDYNKFAKMRLTPRLSANVAAPYIEQSPLNIECRVKQIVPLGSHDMFIADVVSVLADEQFINSTTGAFDMQAAKLIAYSHGHYYKLGDEIGKFGWSVQKKTKN